MIIYAKFKNKNDYYEMVSFPSEEYIDEALELGSYVEVLVDFSELKNYKRKYEEIYSVLFKNYTNEDRVLSEKEFSDTLFTTYDGSDFYTYPSLELAMDNIDSSDSIQIFVNISEIKDYKEKYDEFYTLMLENFKNNNKKDVL